LSHHFVEASELHYTYPDGTEALRGVTFTVRHGDSVGVIGANGAGKSTLLLQMVGCLFPSVGKVVVGDVPVGPDTVESIRSRVGMVFQNPDDQLFMPTVKADVAFGPRNQGLPEEQIERRTRESLDSVGAAHLADRPPYHLSGGEKRAVSIATVLAMSPDVLILDEPSAGLDPRSRRAVIDLLNSFEHTRIIASHDLDLILDVCDRVILMFEGRVEADSDCEKMMRDGELLVRCGLERPLSLQGRPPADE
jgi:cobalt/nickel transport system ATP-binding protein